MGIKITQKNNKLHITGLSPDIVKKMSDYLSIKDPAYEQARRRGGFMRWMKEYKEYYVSSGDIFICGRGVLDNFTKYFDKLELEYEVEDCSVLPDCKRKHKSTIQLRPYQGEVFKDIHGKEQGVLKLSTGFGKSVIALKLFENLGTPTLIIVPKSHLLKQYEKDIKTFFPNETRVGIIQGKQERIEDITLSTIQTLGNINKRGGLGKISETFGAVIVDECDEYITKKRLAAIQSFNPRYLFGLTGTPERTDQQDAAIGWTFGSIITDHELPQEPPTIQIVNSNVKIPVCEYPDMIEMQIENKERNELIAKLVADQVALGHRCIVLTKRVRHTELLCEMIRGSTPIYADMKVKEKTKMFEELRKGKDFSCIIGTYSLLGRGSDIPSLSCLILAGDIKSHVLSKQSVGRVLRLFDKKLSPLVIDVADNLNGMLMNQHKVRKTMYNKNNWKIKL